MSDSILVQSIDIETTSKHVGPNRLMSIGVTSVEIPRFTKSYVIKTSFIKIKWPDGFEYDEDTLAFWEKHKDAFVVNTCDGISPEAAAKELRDHIYDMHKLAFTRKMHYILLTDNSYFDVAWLDWFLSTYCPTSIPLRYNYFTGYMYDSHFVNLKERLQALRDIGYIITIPKQGTPHDHTALNDSKRLVEDYEYYLRTTKYIFK